MAALEVCGRTSLGVYTGALCQWLTKCDVDRFSRSNSSQPQLVSAGVLIRPHSWTLTVQGTRHAVSVQLSLR